MGFLPVLDQVALGATTRRLKSHVDEYFREDGSNATQRREQVEVAKWEMAAHCSIVQNQYLIIWYGNHNQEIEEIRARAQWAVRALRGPVETWKCWPDTIPVRSILNSWANHLAAAQKLLSMCAHSNDYGLSAAGRSLFDRWQRQFTVGYDQFYASLLPALESFDSFHRENCQLNPWRTVATSRTH
jgi:hypothetical protein